MVAGAACTRTPPTQEEVEYGVGQWMAFDPLSTRRQGGETHALYTRLEHTASHESLRPGACVLVRADDGYKDMLTIARIHDIYSLHKPQPGQKIEHRDLWATVHWMHRSPEVTVGDKLVSKHPRELFFSFEKGEVPVTSIVHECKVRFQRDALPMPLKGYVCHRLFVEGKQSKQTHALKDRNYQPKVQILVDRVLTEAAKQALDVLEVQQEAFDGHLHLPLVDGLAHHLYQLSSLTTAAPELPLHHLEQLIDLRRRSLASVVKCTDAVCLHALHHHPTHRPLGTLFVWLDQLKDSNVQLQRKELALDILSAVGNLPVGEKDILEMSGDTVNKVPSTLPHWGILMRRDLRDGQPLGRAVAEQAKALMDRWKAVFQGKTDVVAPVQMTQLEPTDLGLRVNTQPSPVTPDASTPHRAAGFKRKQQEGELASPMRTTKTASNPVLSPSPTHGLGWKSQRWGSLSKLTTGGEQADVEMEQAGSDSTHRTDSNRGGDGGGAADLANMQREVEKQAAEKRNLQKKREEISRRQALTREGDAAAAAAAADADAVAAAAAAAGVSPTAVAATAAGHATSEPTWEPFVMSAISSYEGSADVGSGHDKPATKKAASAKAAPARAAAPAKAAIPAKQAESTSDGDETSSSSDDSDDSDDSDSETPAAKKAAPDKAAPDKAAPAKAAPAKAAPAKAAPAKAAPAKAAPAKAAPAKAAPAKGDETSSSSDDSDDEMPAAKAATPAKPAATPAKPAATPTAPESHKHTRKATWTKAQSDMLNDALKASMDKELALPECDVLNWLVVNLNRGESRRSVTIDDIKVWYKNKRSKYRRALAAAQAGGQQAASPKPHLPTKPHAPTRPDAKADAAKATQAAKPDAKADAAKATQAAKAADAAKATQAAKADAGKATQAAKAAAVEIVVNHPGGESKRFRVAGGLLDLEGTFNKERKNPALSPALMDSSHTLLLPVERGANAVRVRHDEVYTLFFMPKLA